MRRSVTERLPQLAAFTETVLSKSLHHAIQPSATLSRFSCIIRPPAWQSQAQSRWTLNASQILRMFSSLPPYTELAMPALSPTMSHGNLVSWKVKEGQEIAPGDELAEVETDKATLAWENQDEGFIARLLVPEGAQGIAVGDPVAILVEEQDQIAAFKEYTPSSSSSKPTTATEATPSPTLADPSPSPPAPSPIEANSRIGPAARILLEQSNISMTAIHPTGPRHIITKGDVLNALANPQPTSSSSSSNNNAGASKSTTPQQQQQPNASLESNNNKTTTTSAVPYTDIPTTQIRKIIAQRLLESKTTLPHFYLSADVNVDGITQLREAFKSQGHKISVNDCIIKAAALALADVPAANSKWDSLAESKIPSTSIDISIAVATEGGLITPIIKNADKKSLTSIALEVRELAGRARQNKLKPEEFQGGSFSISNLGMFGIDSFSAIINPPQACIMAVGGSRKVAIMGDGGDPAVSTMITVTLSADNRVYDGEVSSAFLSAFAKNMANPYRLMMVDA